jgi:lambda repressor-like predicted transcriptional regulator
MNHKPLDFRAMATTMGRQQIWSTPERGPEWMTDPRRGCAPDHLQPLFTSDNSEELAEAAKICEESCPFRDACRQWAIERGEQSHVWGGLVLSKAAVRKKVARQADPARAREELIGRALTSRPELFREFDNELRGAVVREGIARGISFTKMSSRFGRSVRTLKILAGEEIGDLDRQVLDLYQQGWSDSAIAAAIGVDPSTVWFSRSRQGLPALYGPGGRPRKAAVA